jgi:hypothetical protein
MAYSWLSVSATHVPSDAAEVAVPDPALEVLARNGDADGRNMTNERTEVLSEHSFHRAKRYPIGIAPAKNG